MKNTIVLFFLTYCSLSFVQAQDIITLKSGDEMKARIIKLSRTAVTFIPTNGLDTAYLLREDVIKLQYKSGITILLNETEIPELINTIESDSLFVKGMKDAKAYYKGYTGAAVGTMVTSIFFPWGLIPAIACSAKPPAKNLGYPDQQLMANSSYRDGYVKQAHQIKKKKVWGSFAVGSGLYIGLIGVMSIVAAQSY